MQQFISSYGYLAVFVLMLAESACIPVPSELTMLFAGALSAGAVAGAHLNLVLVIATGVAGNVAGSYLAWGVGAYGGRAAWHRWAGPLQVGRPPATRTRPAQTGGSRLSARTRPCRSRCRTESPG